MTHEFVPPTYDELVAEQAVVQAQKNRSRTLRSYDGYIFQQQLDCETQVDEVTELLSEFVIDDQRPSLKGILESVRAANGGLVHWADMGGGRALPMRQVAADPELGPNVMMTNVDLFDIGLHDLNARDLERLERLAPGMTAESAAPTTVIADAEKVILPQKANVTTSVETIQYFVDPLRAIANWYNQTADNGPLIIAAEHMWSHKIRYPNGLHMKYGDTPTAHMLEACIRHGINFAATDDRTERFGRRVRPDYTQFRTLAIHKKPGTLLRVTQPLVDVLNSQMNYKVAFYKMPEDGSSLVEVIET